ncbi:MAG: endonuclease/exonuclease/phosphatase family protein [Myxococcota bacterium]
MPSVVVLGLVGFCFSSLPSSASAQSDESLELRVLTWNVWALPTISTNLEARVARMGAAIAEVQPQLVALQEVWEPHHGRQIVDDLAALGFPYAIHLFRAAAGKPGLLIASVYPIRGERFVPFSLGRQAHTPWHVDWMAAKGVMDVEIDTPLGPLRFLNTHFQARYRTDDYADVRAAQAAEITADLAGARSPIVFAGDFNSPPGDFPREVLGANGFVDAAPEFGVDTVYVKDGGSLAIDVRSAEIVLELPVPLGDGIEARLSDHRGVLTTLTLTRGSGNHPPPARILSSIPATLQKAASRTRLRTRLLGAGGVLLAVLLVLGRRLAHRPQRRRRWRVLWRVVAVLAVLPIAWLLYLAILYGPNHAGELDAMVERLSPSAAGVEPI